MSPEQPIVQESHGAIFLKNLTTVDCAVFDPALGILGESWSLSVEVHGALDENHFVYDFSKLRKLIRLTAKASIDHALLIPVQSKQVNLAAHESGEVWELESHSKLEMTRRWRYSCPQGAVFPIRAVHIRTQQVEQEFCRLLRHRLGNSITGLRVTLEKEKAPETEAFFRYTHGIAGHDGLCQRMFHGHRSRVEVHVANERRPDLEHYLCREVLKSTIHVATPEQFVESPLEPGTWGDSNRIVHLSFSGSRGHYEALLPGDRVFCVADETSIECITRELARHLRSRIGGHQKIRVSCYEGIDKGAIVEL